MEHGPAHPDPDQPPSHAPSTANARGPRSGIVQRWRDRRARPKRAAFISTRSRGSLARQLRRAAEEPRRPAPIGGRHRVLLHYRAAAVRADLLEIAALLEHAHDPDPRCIAALRDLLRNDASPLYDAAVDASELHATLDRARVALRRPPQ